jgi:hypothetical protein
MIETAILERIGDVPATYVHYPRTTEPGEPLVGRGSVFKWYRVFPAVDPVPEVLDAGTRTFVLSVLERGAINPAYGMGFVVLHHSTEFDFLFICSWRGHQELWDSLFYREAGESGAWTSTPQGEISPVCCVWEMAPIWHERNAWIRYLESARTRTDREAWLADTLRETV